MTSDPYCLCGASDCPRCHPSYSHLLPEPPELSPEDRQRFDDDDQVDLAQLTCDNFHCGRTTS